MSSKLTHAFNDQDALGHHDGIGLAALIRKREVSRAEVLRAAVERARRVNGALNALEYDAFESPVSPDAGTAPGPFAGVPSFMKDTNDVAGWPTRFGSQAVGNKLARKHGAVANELLAQGFTLLGKTTLPEFGLSATTEWQDREPTRNPWNTDYSSGGSSGGSAAFIASGVVPVSHGNDGGGSLRIPAACCGLYGLKVTRGRMARGETDKKLPISIVTEGVMSRTVRDSAHFFNYFDQRQRARKYAPTGLIEGPSNKRLRIGLVLDSIRDFKSDSETRQAVERVGRTLEKLGHRVEPLIPPVPDYFIDDFKLYWGFMAFAIARFGKVTFPGFQASRLERFTHGLVRYFEQRMLRAPLSMVRLQASFYEYSRGFAGYDAVLSPVLTQTTAKLGFLSPRLEFEELFDRIVRYTSFTPLNNAAGSPAISIPAQLSADGLPIGVQLSSVHGGEGTLLDLAYALESELKFPGIAAG